MTLDDIDRLLARLPAWVQSIVGFLRGLIDELSSKVASLQAKTASLEAENAELRRQLYGKKSEKMPSLERELEKEARKHETDEHRAERRNKTRDKRKKNRDKKKALPVEQVDCILPAESRICPKCGGDKLKRWSKGKVSYRVEFIEIRIVRQRIERERWGCSCGQCILTADPPPGIADRLGYGPGFHAHVVTAKCADSIPLTRQVKQFRREGLPVSRSTLCDMFHRCGEIAVPIYDRLVELIALDSHVHADETSFKVQEKGGCRTGWFWVFTAGSKVVYVFSPSRGGQTPMRILGKSKGTLQVDAYTGYNEVVTPEGRDRAGCWSHVRRYAFRALDYAPAPAAEIMERIRDLYLVEHMAASKSIVGSAEHLELRTAASAPVIAEVQGLVERERELHPPSTPINKALNYIHNNWDALTLFLDNAEVALDNNISERRLRIIALGRKNYMFANNERTAQNLAILQTLVSHM